MKSFLMKVGLLSALTVGLFNGTAYAETEWSSKCSSLGEIKQNVNPSFQHINCLLTNAAINANIPPEVVKAVAWKESGWKQFDQNGNPIVTHDNGIGIMQVTDGGYDTERLKSDIAYNIEIGVDILNSKYNLKDLPKIVGANRSIIENWYFSVMAYNGIKPINSPIIQDTGKINVNAYQERVFKSINEQSFINDKNLARFPFKASDFEYDPNSSQNIKFLKTEYTLKGELHKSVYFYKMKEKFLIKGNLRVKPSSSSTLVKKFTISTPVLINGNFVYEKTSTKNHFVWIPVKTLDGKFKGYIASPYIWKDFVKPVISGVQNNHTYNKNVKIRFNEGIATLNGKRIENGKIVSKEGKYTLVVKDKVGNTTIIKFTIDR